MSVEWKTALLGCAVAAAWTAGTLLLVEGTIERSGVLRAWALHIDAAALTLSLWVVIRDGFRRSAERSRLLAARITQQIDAHHRRDGKGERRLTQVT